MANEKPLENPDVSHDWVPRPEILSERFDQALAFAAEAHRLQRRKGSEIAYLGHLLGVCSLVIEEGGSEE